MKHASMVLRLILVWLLLAGITLANAKEHKLMQPLGNTPEAPAFTLPDIMGHQHQLSDYSGLYLLVNFWATWCHPCRKEMPSLNRLDKRLNSKALEVIGIHVGPGVESIKSFLKDVPVNFTILVDNKIQLTGWHVIGLPTTFLVDPEGHIVDRAVGKRSWDSPAMTAFLKNRIGAKLFTASAHLHGH